MILHVQRVGRVLVQVRGVEGKQGRWTREDWERGEGDRQMERQGREGGCVIYIYMRSSQHREIYNNR